MKRSLICTLGLLLAGALLTPSSKAATAAQVTAAIQGGDAHLVAIQCKTAGTFFGAFEYQGSCGNGYEDVFTGQAIYALIVSQNSWPTAMVSTYQTAVNNGVKYLLQSATIESAISVNNASTPQNICPGGSGTCTGIYWNVCGESSYCTGFVTPALDTYFLTIGANVSPCTTLGVTTGLCALPGPPTGLQIAQDITNAFAQGQDATTHTGNGGWHYTVAGNTSADMSTAQWGALSLGFDESVGATTPAFVKTLLNNWLTYDAIGGTACYEGGGSIGTCDIGPDNGENGGWTVSNSYVGNQYSASVIAFMNSGWTTAAGGQANSEEYGGHFGQPYAMWAGYKSLAAVFGIKDNTHITNKLTDCGMSEGNPPASGTCTWYEDYREWLVNGTPTYPSAVPNTQITTDGSGNKYSSGYSSWYDPLSTGIYVAILVPAPIPGSISQVTPSTVPALSNWGLLALAIMLVFFAAMKLRGPQTA